MFVEQPGYTGSVNNIMSGEQAEVKKEEEKNVFWPLNLLPGLTHMYKEDSVIK